MPLNTIEEKTSVSKVQKKVGHYCFRIDGYSGLSTRVGDSVESPEFNLCGHTWQLRIFPGGSLDVHKGYVSFYLASKCTKVARARYKLSIINQIPGGENETFSSSGVRIFEAKGVQVDGWGRDKFVSMNMLKNPELGLCINDVVEFKAEITAFGDLETVSATDLITRTMKKNSLEAALVNMINDEATADLTLLVGPNKEKIFAHRVILMFRSDFFRAMLTSGMSEMIKGEISLPDADPFLVQELLKFLYTDAIPDATVMQTHAEGLLIMAMRYQCPALIEVCEMDLLHRLDTNNAIGLLQLADMIGATTLKQKVMHFVAINSVKLLQSKEFSELTGELLQETNNAIDQFNKRKGCGASFRGSGTGRNNNDRERRVSMGCIIM